MGIWPSSVKDGDHRFRWDRKICKMYLTLLLLVSCDGETEINLRLKVINKAHKLWHVPET